MLTPSGCALSWPESTFEWPARKKRERYTMKKRKKKKVDFNFRNQGAS